jgi:hypothetical protein
MSENIIQFPVRKRTKRVQRLELLPNAKVVTGMPAKVTHLSRLMIDEAFGLDWTAPLVIEFDDPVASGKRDINVRFLTHEGRVWKMKWMDRTAVPGRKRYGLVPAA